MKDITGLAANPLGNDGTAWVRTSTSNLSYRIDAAGNVLGSSHLRYFNGRNELQGWTLDDANNRFRIGGGSFVTLGPGNFTVADITGLSGNPFGNDGSVWVTTSTSNLSWRIASNGSILQSSTLRFFNGRHSFAGIDNPDGWVFDDANNQFRVGNGAFSNFRTSLFTVDQITNIAGNPLVNEETVWVTVQTATVPEPTPMAIFALSGCTFLFSRRSKHRS